MDRTKFVPIEYAGFYDVPRVFFVKPAERSFLFISHFDEAKDDYEDAYTVYIMPAEFRPPPTWEDVEVMAERRLGTIRVADVTFDETLREGVSVDTLDRVTSLR